MFGTDVNLKAQTIPEYVGSSLSIEEILDELIAPLGIPAIAQRAGRPRQAHGDDPARRARAARRRRQDARDPRAGRDVNAAIDRDFDGHLERIREFLRIPSVSADDGDLRSTADAVCELIEAAGGTAEIAEPGEKRPTVIGVIDGPGPTVLRYGMYDVQPPGAGWTREPFAAEIDDGRIYARGAANSKARAGRQPARVRVRAEPVPPGAADGGRGGARQPAARRVLRRSTATSCAPTGRSTSTCTSAPTARRRWWPAARACTSSSCAPATASTCTPR